MSQAPRIFISHSHKDRHLATALQKTLEENGADTYLDQDQIQVSDVLPDRIKQGIAWCDTLLLIWSFNAHQSDWVKDEWNMAYDSRKKIIPYSIDGYELPNVLQNLVFIAKEDRQLGDASLLKAIFGRDFKPKIVTPFPGKWTARVNSSGVASGSYDLNLRTNGQLEGSGKLGQSGLFGQIANQIGVGDILNTPISVEGEWSFDRGTQTLTIELRSSGFGAQTRDIVKIQITGDDFSVLNGNDSGGRLWTLERAETRQVRYEDIDYMKLARDKSDQKWLDNVDNGDDPAGHIILFQMATILFMKDVVKTSSSKTYHSTEIDGLECRASRSEDYVDRMGRKRRDVSFEQKDGNKWSQIKSSFEYKEGVWHLLAE